MGCVFIPKQLTSGGEQKDYLGARQEKLAAALGSPAP